MFLIILIVIVVTVIVYQDINES